MFRAVGFATVLVASLSWSGRLDGVSRWLRDNHRCLATQLSLALWLDQPGKEHGFFRVRVEWSSLRDLTRGDAADFRQLAEPLRPAAGFA
jgi:hypothetical protein